jgi:hypothetical protein
MACLTCRHSSFPQQFLYGSKNNAIHARRAILLDSALSYGTRLVACVYQNEKSLVYVIILIDSILKGHAPLVHVS